MHTYSFLLVIKLDIEKNIDADILIYTLNTDIYRLNLVPSNLNTIALFFLLIKL